MTFACIQNCSLCPFQCSRNKPRPVTHVDSVVRTNTVPEPVKNEEPETGLAVVETIPVFEVKRNIFGKEKVVRKV